MRPELHHTQFTTDDGSHSLRSPRFGVAYHSTHGAIQESEHVFVDAGLLPLLKDQSPREINILEMGFGTGLNALLVRKIANEYPDFEFRYTTCERFPIECVQAQSLNYPELLEIDPALLIQLHKCEWGTEHRLGSNFTFKKCNHDFLKIKEDAGWQEEWVDVIFYDAFAPDCQPELWSPDAMDICYQLLKIGSVLVTYCAKGQFKRDLRQMGFKVEALPGPIGKREMTRAKKM